MSLRCKQNCFVAMDSSLQLLPAVRLLDLSNNNISELQNLHACSSLTDLNLSYNNIASLSPLRDCAGQLRRLILQVSAKFVSQTQARGSDAAIQSEQYSLAASAYFIEQKPIAYSYTGHLKM